MEDKKHIGCAKHKRKLNLGVITDSRATAKRIVIDFTNHNPSAAKFYFYNIRSKAPTTPQDFHDYVLPGHPLNSFPEDWDGDLNYQYFEKFTYRSLRPRMITPIRYVGKEDPVTEYMDKKIRWHNTNKLNKLFIFRWKHLENIKKLNDEVVYCPKLIVDFAKHFESDPLPYFDSSYNWHYAGNGNMQLVCIDWIDYILHSEFSTVSLTRFCSDILTLEFNDTVSFDCGDDNNILETICSSENIVVLRTMYKIFILKIQRIDDKLVFEQIKTIDSKLPFTGINFDGYHKNILYVVTLDCKLTIVNLDRMTGRSVKCRFDNDLLNNWNTVIGSERSYFTHVVGAKNSGSISIYDKRTNNIVDKWKDVTKACDLPCNFISAASQKENSPLMYITTNHHLFTMDLRNMTTPKAVQRWTHGMNCVPTYITRCNFELGKELICFSSQWCEDMCVVPNYVERPQKLCKPNGVTIPYRPPNILSTLKLARQNFLCTDTHFGVDKRLATTITGISAIEQADRYVILMHNSLGDITSHILYPQCTEGIIEDDSFRQLEEWSKMNKVDKEYVVSDVINIKKVWESLKSVPDDFVPKCCLPKDVPSKFDEDEIYKTFEDKDMDAGLLEIWSGNAAGESSADYHHEADGIIISDEDDGNQADDFDD